MKARACSGTEGSAKEGGKLDPPTRLLVMAEPPQIDGNEITDKGYINQRAVLERRAALVEKLHSDSPEAKPPAQPRSAQLRGRAAAPLGVAQANSRAPA